MDNLSALALSQKIVNSKKEFIQKGREDVIGFDLEHIEAYDDEELQVLIRREFELEFLFFILCKLKISEDYKKGLITEIAHNYIISLTENFMYRLHTAPTNMELIAPTKNENQAMLIAFFYIKQSDYYSELKEIISSNVFSIPLYISYIFFKNPARLDNAYDNQKDLIDEESIEDIPETEISDLAHFLIREYKAIKMEIP